METNDTMTGEAARMNPPPLPICPPPLPSAPAAVGAVPVSSEERTLATLCHVLGIFTGFLGPLILWLVKKDASAFVDHHGREALNFQLTLMLIMFTLAGVTVILMMVLVGILLIPVLIAVPILALVAEVLASAAASEGRWHRYPFCLRLV